MAEMTEGRSSEEIRRDIDETRSNMDETVNALERKLTPGQILDDLLDRFRGSGGSGGGGAVGSAAGSVAKSAGHGLGELFKNHPMPTALMTVGLGWLVVDKVGGGSGHEGGHAGEEARERAYRAREGIGHFIQEQPLATGAILFGAGLAAGLLTPSTRWEDETMGRTADTVKHEGRELVRDTAEAAMEVAGKAARERAEEEGRTGERMGSRAPRAARRTRETAEREFE